MSNLAYDYSRYNELPIENDIEEEKPQQPQRLVKKKSKRVNSVVMAIAGGVMFLALVTPYIWRLNAIMNCNIQIDKQNLKKAELTAEINRLKAEYDSKIDYKKVEEVAVTKLGFVPASKVKYIKD